MFRGTDMKPFEKKVWLASPTMHGEEMEYMKEAYDTNWMSTVGANINEVERIAAEKAGVKYAVALSACTAALHLCVKLAGEKLYGRPAVGHGAVEGKRVFCSDMTFDATLNPVLYEGGIPVFIDTNPETWNMDPAALEKAFEMYPEVKLVVCAELYGFPGGIREIKEICEKHGALLDEHTAALDPKTALKVLTLSAKIVEENHLTTMMITHNMKDAIKYGNRLIMMHEGHIIYDVAGEEKKNLHVSDLLAKFQIASGGEFANDRMMLS